MKNKMFPIIGILLLGGLLLSGCAQGLMPASWPGITTDGQTSPAVAYVAAGASLYAVDIADNSQKWSFPAKPNVSKPFYATPVLTGDNQLIVGGYDYKLYSLDPDDGSIRWEFNGAKDRYIGSVLVTADRIYAPNADYKLYALDLKGNLQWSFAAEQSFWSAPVADGNSLYIGSLDRKLYALDAETGDKRWEKDLGAAILCSPVTATDLPLFVATFGGKLVALDKSNGSILWEKGYEGRIWSSPVFLDGILYFGDEAGMFYAVNASDGDVVWEENLKSAILGSPLVTKAGIFFGTEAGDLYAYGLDGKKMWDDSLNADKVTINLYGTPILAGDVILIAPVGGTDILIAYDQTGKDVWSFAPKK
jgi:eukaryotic-like serine/threonine-protein kinase